MMFVPVTNAEGLRTREMNCVCAGLVISDEARFEKLTGPAGMLSRQTSVLLR